MGGLLHLKEGTTDAPAVSIAMAGALQELEKTGDDRPVLRA